ncbi:uncharacterized protein LOC142990963 [Genypterus blacodes]|uniref:uncharacterized protein LOC142990963 n=1 Tax=Genypterus blacodes TaxID=154954 RepID=UPI003F7707BD
MDGVLEGAAVLCACKLACSVLVLPTLSKSVSPVSFCCCCLLVFTDALVTVFLSLLYISEWWLPRLSSRSDVIALRFLLFLSHTYGAVLLLLTPVIAVETTTRLLQAHTVNHRTVGEQGCHGTVGQSSCTVEMTIEQEEEEEEDRNECSEGDQGTRMSHVAGYLCCLTVWIVVGLNVRWQWKVEELWAGACLHTTNSLIRCLPNLFSPMHRSLDPCWGMAFLSLLLFLTATTGLMHQTQVARTHRKKNGDNNNSNSAWQDLALEPSGSSKPLSPVTAESEAAPSVDPEKTDSSCNVHRIFSGNSVQMSACHHGDFVLVSPECLSAEKGGQRTLRGTPLAFIIDLQLRSPHVQLQRGFPCLGVNVMIGCVALLSIFILPLNLSVNILLIRTVETFLESCIKSLIESGTTIQRL